VGKKFHALVELPRVRFERQWNFVEDRLDFRRARAGGRLPRNSGGRRMVSRVKFPPRAAGESKTSARRIAR